MMELFGFLAMRIVKNKAIEDGNWIQLLFMNNSSSAYLCLFGIAGIITGTEKLKKLWNVFLKTWFNEGH